MHPCQICGNEMEQALQRCPYCGSEQAGEQRKQVSGKTFQQKTVNLEQGLPLVNQALRRLERELQTARLEGVRVLTIIHGYGSTGKGGAIRRECRRTLEYLQHNGQVDTVVYGEDFSRRQGTVKQLLSRFPALCRHSHLNQQNRGITLVVL